MRHIQFVRLACWLGLVAAPVISYGQTANYYNLVPPSRPAVLNPTGYLQSEQAPAESPSDLPEATATETAPAVEPICDSCTPATSSDCYTCGPCCDPCTPWELPEPCALKTLGLTYGGWLSGGVYGNQFGASDNGVLGFRDVAGGTMDQVWFYLDKEAESRCGDWDWGFHMDLVFGADAPDTQTFGTAGGQSGTVGAGAWDNEWVSSTDGVYGWAMPQLYGELAIGEDLKVKMGHFYTIIGYEVVPAPDNFFYSHALTMYYGEPFTHTGALATYGLSDDIELYGGWVNGWDQGWLNPTEASQVIGGTSLTLTDDITFTYAMVAGNTGQSFNGTRYVGSGDAFVNSFVVDVALTENLNYVFQHDLGSINNWVNDDGSVSYSQWFGINQYLFYEINDCWQAGMRVEWFCDDDGVRLGNGAANYSNLTFGLNWKPTANVTFRPEMRWDAANGLAGNQPLPFNDGTNSYQFSGGFDFIVTY